MSSSCNPAATHQMPLPTLRNTKGQTADRWLLLLHHWHFNVCENFVTLTCGSPARVPPGCIKRPIVTFVKYVHTVSYTAIQAVRIFPCGRRASPHQRLWPFAIKRLNAQALTHAKHAELSVHFYRNLPHEPITVTHPETMRSFFQSRNYTYMSCTTATGGSLPYSHEPSTCPILHQILHILTTTSLKSILILPSSLRHFLPNNLFH